MNVRMRCVLLMGRTEDVDLFTETTDVSTETVDVSTETADVSTETVDVVCSTATWHTCHILSNDSDTISFRLS